jgi:signal peptidase II
VRAASLHPSLPWLLLALALVVADQVTKAWVLNALTPYEPVAVTPFFNLVLVHNTGAAFSLLAEAGGWQRWFFVVLTVVIGAIVSVWLWRSAGSGRRATPLALSLVLGGAIGNLIDRLRFGHVIDFLDFHAAGWHWPAFNLADSAISCGAVLLVLLALAGRE